MADLRCPMCGKPNPADREVCQFCQARLKPLVSSSGGGSEDSESRAGIPDNELPEWLKALRQKNASDKSAAEQPLGGREVEGEDALPEWLRGESGSSSTPPPPARPKSSSNEPGLPDWLTGLRDEGSAAAEPQTNEPEAEPEPDEGDWWQRTGEQGAGYSGAGYSGAEFSGDENRGADDWLNSMRSDSGAAASGGRSEDAEPDWLKAGEPQADETAGTVPDWINPFRAGPGADDFERSKDETAAPAPQDEMPDWLNAFGRDAAEPAGQETGQDETPPDAPVGDTPDWMAQFHEPPFESKAETGDLPDWMAQFAPGAEAADDETPTGALEAEDERSGSDSLPSWFAAGEPEEPPPSAEQTQDWLKQFSAADKSDLSEGSFQSEGEAEDFAEAAPQATAAGDLPDWLAQFGAAPAEPEPGPEPETPPAEEALPAGGMSSWFSQEAAPGDAGQDLPDWMSGLTGETPAAEPETDEPEAARERELPQGIVPDWLKDLEEDPPAAEAGELEPPSPPAEAGPETVATGAADEFPDWMGPLAGSAPPVEELAEPGNLTPKDDIEDDLAWLHALESNAPPLPSEASAVAAFASRVDPFFNDEESQKELEPLFDAEIPDWLTQISPDAPAGPSGVTPEEASLQASLQGDPSAAEPNLEPADMPNWLQAMRPSEPEQPDAAGPAESEAAGPLTGLRGVLKAEPEITRVSKPTAQTLKLDVTPAQQAHVDLLLKMIQAEGEPRPLPARPAITSQHVLRIVMALVLIAAIVWPLVTGSPTVSLPAFPAEMAPVVEQINSLQPGAAVLVAVDYEPGLAGEMDPLAASLVHHLMLKGAHLTLVSTTPNGPAQAERLIGLAYSRMDPEGQFEAERYANLGYIPGGAAGLLSFADYPARLLPLTVQGDPAWQEGPLSGMTGVRDFALLLVITQDPDDARVWIEQVQPRLEGKPLLMATSAQAAPLVLPYWTNGANQVQGLVSGLAGGASYDQILGRTAEAQAYWPAYSLGLLAAAGLILIGGLYNLALAGLSHRKPPAGTPPSRRATRKSAAQKSVARKSAGGRKAAPTEAAPEAAEPAAAGEADAPEGEAPAAEAPEPGRANQNKAKGKRKP